MNGFGPLTTLKNRDTRILMEVALGKAPADLVIVNGNLVNVYTAEILEQHVIGIKNEWIAYVGPGAEGLIGSATEVIDAAGFTLTPGLIEGHTHLTAFYGVDEFLKYAVPGGTTTIVTETFEAYPVGGLAGVLDLLESFRHQPVKVFGTAPAMGSICSKTLGIPQNDLQVLLDREDILGIGEAYWQGVLQSPDAFLPQFAQTLRSGKLLEGHSAGARNQKLMAYAACGITSCHEPITAEDALDRLRLGIYVMAREGGIRKDLKTLSEIKNKKVDLRRFILSTDGVMPEELIQNGYLDTVVRKAISYGFDPVSAVQMATINVAEHYKLDHLIGGIAPGKLADILILPDLPAFSPEVVISNGKIVARRGKPLVAARKHTFSVESRNSIQPFKALTPSDFTVKAPNENTTQSIRVIEMVSNLLTAEKHLTVPARNGEIAISVPEDLLKIAAIDRTHTPGQQFTGFIQGFGLRCGALAGSATWDSSDIIVIGSNESDMALAVNWITESQGGVVLCREGKVVEALALPVLGLISQAPMAEIAARISRINKTANEFGVPFADPLLALITQTTAAIPYFRICDEGLVNLKDGRTKTLFLKE